MAQTFKAVWVAKEMYDRYQWFPTGSVWTARPGPFPGTIDLFVKVDRHCSAWRTFNSDRVARVN